MAGDDNLTVRVFESAGFRDKYTVLFSDLTFLAMSEDCNMKYMGSFNNEVGLNTWLKGTREINFSMLPKVCQEAVHDVVASNAE